MGGTLPRSELPDASRGPTLEAAFLGTPVSGLCVNSSARTPNPEGDLTCKPAARTPEATHPLAVPPRLLPPPPAPSLQRLLAPGSVSHVDLNRSQVFPSSVCLQCLPSIAQHRKHRFGVFFLIAYFHKTLTLKDDSNEIDPLRHIRLTLS